MKKPIITFFAVAFSTLALVSALINCGDYSVSKRSHGLGSGSESINSEFGEEGNSPLAVVDVPTDPGLITNPNGLPIVPAGDPSGYTSVATDTTTPVVTPPCTAFRLVRLPHQVPGCDGQAKIVIPTAAFFSLVWLSRDTATIGPFGRGIQALVGRMIRPTVDPNKLELVIFDGTVLTFTRPDNTTMTFSPTDSRLSDSILEKQADGTFLERAPGNILRNFGLCSAANTCYMTSDAISSEGPNMVPSFQTDYQYLMGTNSAILVNGKPVLTGIYDRATAVQTTISYTITNNFATQIEVFKGGLLADKTWLAYDNDSKNLRQVISRDVRLRYIALYDDAANNYNLVGLSSPLKALTKYRYYPNGILKAVIDPRNYATWYAYNAAPATKAATGSCSHPNADKCVTIRTPGGTAWLDYFSWKLVSVGSQAKTSASLNYTDFTYQGTAPFDRIIKSVDISNSARPASLPGGTTWYSYVGNTYRLDTVVYPQRYKDKQSGLLLTMKDIYQYKTPIGRYPFYYPVDTLTSTTTDSSSSLIYSRKKSYEYDTALFTKAVSTTVIANGTTGPTIRNSMNIDASGRAWNIKRSNETIATAMTFEGPNLKTIKDMVTGSQQTYDYGLGYRLKKITSNFGPYSNYNYKGDGSPDTLVDHTGVTKTLTTNNIGDVMGYADGKSGATYTFSENKAINYNFTPENMRIIQ